ncbi:MAG: DUF6531 domain-containing protein, partial [Culicoidibacterales bacterium]
MPKITKATAKKYLKKSKQLLFGTLSFIITLTSIQIQTASSFYATQATTGPYADVDVTTANNEVPRTLIENEPNKVVEKPVEKQGQQPLPALESANANMKAYSDMEALGYSEDKGARTLESKTFVKGGMSETFVYTGPIHYQSNTGSLEDYDLTLTKNKRTKNGIQTHTPKQTDMPITIPESLNPNSPISISTAKGKMTIAPQTSLENPEIAGQVARYKQSDGHTTSVITLDSGVKIKETYTSGLPEEITYIKTVPAGFTLQNLADNKGVGIVEEGTNLTVGTMGLPQVIAGNEIYPGDIQIKATPTAVKNRYEISIYGLKNVVALPTPTPMFPIDIITSDVLLDQGQVIIYGINMHDSNQTYGPGKGNSFGEMFMLGFNNNALYYPTGLYRSIVNTTVGDWRGLLGDGREVTNATFGMLEFTASGTTFTEDDLSFRAYRIEDDYGGRPADVTWDQWIGASANLLANDAQVFSKTLNTFAEFNITEAVTAWYSGAPNYGLYLDGAREDAGLLFLNHDSSNSYIPSFDGIDGRPYIRITHQKVHPIPDDYDINETTVNLRPFTSAQQGGLLHFQALGFDGIATPGSAIDLEVYEVEGGKKVHSQVIKAQSGYRNFPYYEPPLYPEIEKVQKYYGLKSNWQAANLLYTKDLAKDKLYGVKVRAQKIDGNGQVTQTGNWVESDRFQVYKAKGFDHLPRILNFYGLHSNQQRVTLLTDNHMRDELILENNEIFIRNPQENKGKPYIGPPLSEKDKEQIDGYLMGQGKHCEFGYEPINLNTGNFYYTYEDSSFFDYDKQFDLTRHYNAMAGSTEGMFGRNWEFTWQKHLTFRADGSAIFHDGTGRRVTLDKQQDGSYTAPFGEQLRLTEIKVGEKDYTYENGYYDTVDDAPKTQTDRINVYEYRLSDSTGKVYTFTRDGQIKEIILDRYGKTINYDYNAKQMINKITTASGKEINFAYNDAGYVNKMTLPDKTAITYSYDSEGNLTTFTDALGYTVTYEYKDAQKPNLMTSYLDRQQGDMIIVNTYDEQNRVIKQVDAKGDTVRFAYFGDHTEITNFNGDKEYVYVDDFKRTTKKIAADGLEKKQTYDGNNNLMMQNNPTTAEMGFVYDTKQNKLAETRIDGKTKLYAYNDQSMPTTVTNFDGTETQFTYDAYDNMTGIYYADGSSVESTYNQHGQKLTEKDRNGNVVSFGYDAAGNQITSTNAFGTKTKTYDGLSMITSQSDAAGLTTTYIRNNRGELLAQHQPQASTTYAYDADGQKLFETDGNGNQKR